MTNDSVRFGKITYGQFFCNMGLESFMLQTVQFQAVLQEYSCNLYLQSNIATTVARYYQHQGFVEMDSNNSRYLPETLITWCQQVKKKKTITPFVYFATDEELIQDTICNKENPDAPEI